MREKAEMPENVRLTDDREYAVKLFAVMERNGGYCPCRLAHTEENLCICEEFRSQIADPEFSGFCHCRLYYKEK
jgi:ferredoxin-thioredoxin reductase catalytic subunit